MGNWEKTKKLKKWRDKGIKEAEGNLIYFGRRRRLLDKLVGLFFLRRDSESARSFSIGDMSQLNQKAVNDIFQRMLVYLENQISKENDPERRRDLVELYEETVKITEDYLLRIKYWDKIAYSFVHNKVLISDKEILTLRGLEADCAKFNRGKGLAALKKAVKRLDKIKESCLGQNNVQYLREELERVFYEKEYGYGDDLKDRQPLNERFGVQKDEPEVRGNHARSGIAEVTVERDVHDGRR